VNKKWNLLPIVPLIDPHDKLGKLENFVWGPSWHKMASTEEVCMSKITLNQSWDNLRWWCITGQCKWMCSMSRLSWEDQSRNCWGPRPSSHGGATEWAIKRKWQAFAIGDLSTCVYGEVTTPQSEDVIPCKQMGCESKWVSFYSFKWSGVLTFD
jgi:hypothetical protein